MPSPPRCVLFQAVHQEQHLGERGYAEDWWTAGEHQPHLVTAFSMDAPTETQFDLPVQKRTAQDAVKALDSAKKWSSKITGLMVAGSGMLVFVSRDGLGSGPNLSCTVLYLSLLFMVAAGLPIGEKFNLLLDNTSGTLISNPLSLTQHLTLSSCLPGDNKNNEMLFFLAWLVASGYVNEASFFCMQKGHTYCRIDQSFRTLIVQLLSTAVWTVTQLCLLISRYLRPYGCRSCVELHHFWDWKGFFAPHVHERFTGFATGQFGSGMHEFVFRKDHEGNVRFYARQSSAASSWLPEGEGYLVFKSIPTGQPGIAKAKEDTKWGRSTVIQTVQSWFRFMPVTEAALVGIKQDWNQRFSDLPPADGDLSQLRADMKLAWADLPLCQPQRGGPAQELQFANTTDAMENPAVNPITGPGRTTADVARELRAYKQDVRANALNALFQADFLFVERLPDLPLALHRVVHNQCLRDAVLKDISFTTVEYEHHAQPDFSGFFGHFTIKANPDYDAAAQDRKAGGKFLRHQNITREDVVMYNVDVFEKKGAGISKQLYVGSAALDALSLATPKHPQLPAELPATHRPAGQPAVGAGEAAGRRDGRGRGRGRGRVAAEGHAAGGRAAGGHAAGGRAAGGRAAGGRAAGGRAAGGAGGGRAAGGAGGGAPGGTGSAGRGTTREGTAEGGGAAAAGAEGAAGGGGAAEGAAEGAGAEGAGGEAMGEAGREGHSKVGMRMEVQACDSDCMLMCSELHSLQWDACTVVADLGSSCHICMSGDNEVIQDVSCRFLRLPGAKRKRSNGS